MYVNASAMGRVYVSEETHVPAFLLKFHSVQDSILINLQSRRDQDEYNL